MRARYFERLARTPGACLAFEGQGASLVGAFLSESKVASPLGRRSRAGISPEVAATRARDNHQEPLNSDAIRACGAKCFIFQITSDQRSE
jgi:hypothetical protein